MPTIYEHRDEIGATLNYYSTLKEADQAIKEWLEMGCETQYFNIEYENTRSGICKLLNSIKQEV